MIQHDSQTFSKAATVGLVGLVVQFVLTAILALIGIYAGSNDAILAAAFAAALGLPAWAILQIYLGQLHKERVELLETRALENRPEAGGMFEEASLAEVRRRINRIEKWGFPIVSLAVALAQMGLGAWLAHAATKNWLPLSDGDLADKVRRMLEGAEQVAAINPVLALLGLGLVVLASFFLARYVAGMTRQKEWQVLRGGASALLACSILAGLAALAFVLAVWGNMPKALAYGAVVLPLLLAAQGLETTLVLLFDLYRPHKAGEPVRPAFDSRLLGWLSGPESLGRLLTETLRYQFGFEISSSWFVRLLSKTGLPLAGATLALVAGASCIHIVAPHERAVVVTCGVLGEVRGPGLYFKAPWPLAKVRSLEVDRVKRLAIAGHPFDTAEEAQKKADQAKASGEIPTILWTGRDELGRKDELLITAGAKGDGATSGEVLAADIAVLYRIDDAHLGAYLNTAEDPAQVLESAARREVAFYFATHTADALLGEGRLNAAQTIKERIRAAVPPEQLGLEVLEVSLAGLRPPRDVAAAFLDKVNARQEAETEVQKAVREQAETLTAAAGSQEKAGELIAAIKAYTDAADAGRAAGEPESLAVTTTRARVEALMERAGGTAADTLHAARADRWTRSGDEAGKAKRFEALLGAYRAAPDYFKQRRLLDSLVATMGDRSKIVFDKADGTASSGQINLKLQDSSGNGNILSGGK